MSAFGMQNSLLTIPSFAPKDFSVPQMLLISYPAIKSAHQVGIHTPFGIKPGSYEIVSSAEGIDSQTHIFVLMPFTRSSSVSASSAADTNNSDAKSMEENFQKNTEQALSDALQAGSGRQKAQTHTPSNKKDARLDVRWSIMQILMEDHAHPERKPRTKAEIMEIAGCGETLVKKMKRLFRTNTNPKKEDLLEKKRGPKPKLSSKIA